MRSGVYFVETTLVIKVSSFNDLTTFAVGNSALFVSLEFNVFYNCVELKFV